MSESHSTTVNFNIMGLLGILFIALKLTHVIDWSWWWVLAPFWIGIPIMIILLLIFLLIVWRLK